LSLKRALEQLLGGRCYHMIEVFGRPDDVGVWRAAAEGDLPDWDVVFDGYVATVDWPSVSFWREIANHYDDALILHSTRVDAKTWWNSADDTILKHARRISVDEPDNPWVRMWAAILRNRFVGDFNDSDAWMAAYDAHNADVRATAPANRYLAWQPGDGWEPICAALGVDIPDAPFPHVNTREEWAQRS
jgi:hypothetical protein